jgi:uncharacterized RDD family membrane protein YckC
MKTPKIKDLNRTKASNLILASRWQRLLANVIDVLGILPKGIANPSLTDSLIASFSFFNIAVWLFTLGVLVINLVLLVTEGQTIGKYFLRIRIVQVKTDQNGGFWTNCFLRNLLTSVILLASYLLKLNNQQGMATSLVLIPLLIDILFIFRKDRRCLHDWIAGTRVVKV